MQQATNPALGHNNPPNDAEVLVQTLRENNHIQLTNAQKLVDAADRIPAEIEDEETASKATDYIKQVNGSVKTLEAIRVNEKQPYLQLGKVVDGVFNTAMDSLEGAKRRALKPLDAWNKKKEAAERRRREEEAAAQRKLAEEQAMAAAAAEKAQQTEEAAGMLDQAAITEQAAQTAQRAAEARPCEMAKTRGTTGAVSNLRTVWVGEMADIVMLDLEVLRYHISPEALQKAVNSFVKAGGRKLTGAKIYEKSETVVR